ncbi:MAG: hypothetical protein RLY85_342, partial [Bacteroidota bacterium]
MKELMKLKTILPLMALPVFGM